MVVVVFPGSIMENRLRERLVGRGTETSWEMIWLIQREIMVFLPRMSVVGDRKKH